MEDYTGNSRRVKPDEAGSAKEEKVVEKVVVGTVVVQKKSIGRRLREYISNADLKGVARYVVTDVLVPSAKNMIYDAGVESLKRSMFGQSTIPRRSGTIPGLVQRITYNSPINRSSPMVGPGRVAPPVEIGPRRSSRYGGMEGIILSTRDDADRVLESMINIIEKYDVVSVHDLNEIVGLPNSHTDQKWGWVFLGDVQVRQTRDGYLIEFPEPEPIS